MSDFDRREECRRTSHLLMGMWQDRKDILSPTDQQLTYGIILKFQHYGGGDGRLTSWEIDTIPGIFNNILLRGESTPKERMVILKVNGMFDLLKNGRLPE